MQIITSEKAPKAIGPYSQAVQSNGLLFMSGQIALDPISMTLVEGGVEAQAKQVLKNIEAVLQSAGLDKNQIVKCSVFLDSLNDFAKVNEIYSEFFGDHKPARSTFEVSRLPLGALVEIEVIAELKA